MQGYQSEYHTLKNQYDIKFQTMYEEVNSNNFRCQN